MSIVARSVNFGINKTGLSTIGYTLYNPDRTVNTSRSTSDVAELATGSGIYSANITFPADFKGYIVWDTGESGESNPLYAIESIDFKLPADVVWDELVSDHQTTSTFGKFISDLLEAESGKWELVGNQLIIYESDNATELFRFNVYNSAGAPSMTEIVKREKV